MDMYEQLNIGKVCGKCKQKKSLEEFNKNASKPDGFSVWCKECRKAYVKMYVKKKKRKSPQYQIRGFGPKIKTHRLAKNIRALRNKYGLSMKKLTLKLGWKGIPNDDAFLSHVELRKSGIATSIVKKIASVFNVSYEDLLKKDFTQEVAGYVLETTVAPALENGLTERFQSMFGEIEDQTIDKCITALQNLKK